MDDDNSFSETIMDMNGKKSLPNVNKRMCRICQTPNGIESPLISPCDCKGATIKCSVFMAFSGTLAFVHFSCLERWLNTSSRNSCELCNFRFEARQTRRYTLWQSLRLWVRHPVNWRHIQADLFILSLLSVVTLGLVLVCLLGLEYFVIEGKKYGVSHVWTKGALSFFLVIIISGYFGSVAFLVKDQLKPWYHWWRNTYNIQLFLNSEIIYPKLCMSEVESEESVNPDFPAVHSQTKRSITLA